MKKPCVIADGRHFVFGTKAAALRHEWTTSGARFHWHRWWHFWTKRG